MHEEKSLQRFSISMQADLVGRLDAFTQAKGYGNRSHAIATLVRERLVEHLAETGTGEIAGTVTLVYDHHKRNLQALLTGIQHDHGELIIAAMHVHLDHHACMEVLAVRGPAARVKTFAERLFAVKGVQHGTLAITTPARAPASAPQPPAPPHSGPHTSHPPHRRPRAPRPE